MLTIAILLKVIMKRSFSVTQWEALVLLILGITVNQLACSTHPTPEDDRVISWLGYCYTLMSVTIPSAASVYNEQALKSNYETSVHLQVGLSPVHRHFAVKHADLGPHSPACARSCSWPV